MVNDSRTFYFIHHSAGGCCTLGNLEMAKKKKKRKQNKDDGIYKITLTVTETEDPPSSSDVFVESFIGTLHKWVIAFVVLAIMGALIGT